LDVLGTLVVIPNYVLTSALNPPTTYYVITLNQTLTTVPSTAFYNGIQLINSTGTSWTLGVYTFNLNNYIISLTNVGVQTTPNVAL